MRQICATTRLIGCIEVSTQDIVNSTTVGNLSISKLSTYMGVVDLLAMDLYVGGACLLVIQCT